MSRIPLGALVKQNSVEIDTQTYAEDTPTTRASKHWKKVKEISGKLEKRPPWRRVGLSTLPAADREAILKAKLLDATRRLRPGNKLTVSTQTDSVPSKLMKEVNIDIQTDLIGKRDVEILTDGAVTLRHEGTGELIITHSVAQMSDVILIADAQTQTATPRVTNKFFNVALYNYHSLTGKPRREDQLERNLYKYEKMLRQQVKEIGKIDRKLNSINQGTSENADFIDSEQSDDSLREDDDDDNVDDLYQLKIKQQLSKQNTLRSESRPVSATKPSYRNFNLSENEIDNLRAAWNEGFFIDNKHSKIQFNSGNTKRMVLQKKSITWNDEQHNAVVQLINEANALLCLFEEIGILVGPDLKLNNLPEKDTINIKYLSEYWGPIVRQSVQMLTFKLNALHAAPFKKAEFLNPDQLENDI